MHILWSWAYFLIVCIILLHYFFVSIFQLHAIFCNMFISSKASSSSNNSDLLNELDSSDFQMLDSSSNSIHSSHFASQVRWSFNTSFYEKKKILRKTIDKIKKEFPLLIFIYNDEYVEWNVRYQVQFEKWWWQTSIDKVTQEKFNSKFKNSLWFKKDQANKHHDIWEKFTQIVSIVKSFLKIVCNKCHKINDHSTTSLQSSTFNMRKHLDDQECQLKKRLNSSSQIKMSLSRVSLKE